MPVNRAVARQATETRPVPRSAPSSVVSAVTVAVVVDGGVLARGSPARARRPADVSAATRLATKAGGVLSAGSTTTAGAIARGGGDGAGDARSAVDLVLDGGPIDLDLHAHRVDAVGLPLLQRPVAPDEAVRLGLDGADRLALRGARLWIDEVVDDQVDRLPERILERPLPRAGGVSAHHRRLPGRDARSWARSARPPARQLQADAGGTAGGGV